MRIRILYYITFINYLGYAIIQLPEALYSLSEAIKTFDTNEIKSEVRKRHRNDQTVLITQTKKLHFDQVDSKSVGQN